MIFALRRILQRPIYAMLPTNEPTAKTVAVPSEDEISIVTRPAPWWSRRRCVEGDSMVASPVLIP